MLRATAFAIPGSQTPKDISRGNVMRNTRFEVRPTSGALGAELLGIDLSRSLDAEGAADIRQALNEHGVIFFRDQHLTPEQHIAFAESMGPINVSRFFKSAPGYPQIAEVRKEPAQTTNIGGGWHTDQSYDQIPVLGSILLAREVPPRGGDTMFACMAQAYDALSDGLKKTLKGLRAIHSSRHVFGAKALEANPGRRALFVNAEAATQDAVHPVVIRHPESGRPTLYVNSNFTTHFEGWTAQESKPLLEFLYAHASRPEFQTRFQWQEGSIAFWDNRATWHYALNDYQGERRLMHRITIEGVPLEAA
jgi:taurine dioxygenase